MKWIWAIAIAGVLGLFALWQGEMIAALVPAAGVGAAFGFKVLGFSGAVIFTLLSLGGRVPILFTVAVLVFVGMMLANS